MQMKTKKRRRKVSKSREKVRAAKTEKSKVRMKISSLTLESTFPILRSLLKLLKMM
jgi:hypothetical protein